MTWREFFYLSAVMFTLGVLAHWVLGCERRALVATENICIECDADGCIEVECAPVEVDGGKAL